MIIAKRIERNRKFIVPFLLLLSALPVQGQGDEIAPIDRPGGLAIVSGTQSISVAQHLGQKEPGWCGYGLPRRRFR